MNDNVKKLEKLKLQRDLLVETMRMIAEPGCCTGEDAVNFQHWARAALRDAGIEEVE